MAIHWIQGAPFFVGAFSILLGLPVQRLGDYILQKDFNAAMNDESGNVYGPPPNFDQDGLRRRWARDADALLAVGFSASTVGTAVVLLDQKSFLFYIGLGLGLLVPLSGFALIMTTHPQQYFNRTRRGMTPFVRYAFMGGMAIGGLALLIGPL